jgi:diaminopimelate decarboxylase
VVATSAERFVASARALLDAADFPPAFLDLGGAWHGVPDLARAFAALRAELALELLVEPGRVLALGAGFATGRVCVARRAGDRELRVVELSRIAHLRWSAIELVAPPPSAGGRSTLFVGPTCFEEDALGEWIVASDYAPDERVVFAGATGYAVAWNTGFGGVPPADVALV